MFGSGKPPLIITTFGAPGRGAIEDHFGGVSGRAEAILGNR
jgi:hypothetical protein